MPSPLAAAARAVDTAELPKATQVIGGRVTLFDLLDHPEVLGERAACEVRGRHPEVAVVSPIGAPGVAAFEVELPADRLVADCHDGMAAERLLLRLRHRHDPVLADVRFEGLSGAGGRSGAYFAASGGDTGGVGEFSSGSQYRKWGGRAWAGVANGHAALLE